MFLLVTVKRKCRGAKLLMRFFPDCRFRQTWRALTAYRWSILISHHCCARVRVCPKQRASAVSNTTAGPSFVKLNDVDPDQRICPRLVGGLAAGAGERRDDSSRLASARTRWRVLGDLARGARCLHRRFSMGAIRRG